METIINNLLANDELKIYQKPNMFNFSLDSLLLASFCTINNKIKNIIDLCSGNAPIPLYLTRRTNNKIEAIEIQKEVYQLGQKSIEHNKLENQIKLICMDLINSHKYLNKVYDLVTVNPPFFKVHDEERLNDSTYKTIARHEVLVKLEDIIIESKKLLNNNGYFAMIHRPERLSEILEVMNKHNIMPRRIRFVHPFVDKDANMVLIEGKKSTKGSHLIVLKPLIVYNKDNTYTSEVSDIFNIKK